MTLLSNSRETMGFHVLLHACNWENISARKVGFCFREKQLGKGGGNH